jgi:hypothetical protein
MHIVSSGLRRLGILLPFVALATSQLLINTGCARAEVPEAGSAATSGQEAYDRVVARNNDPYARGDDGRALNRAGRCKASVVDFLQVAGASTAEVEALIPRGDARNVGEYWIKNKHNPQAAGLPAGWRVIDLKTEARDLRHGGVVFYTCRRERRGHMAFQIGEPARMYDNHTRAIAAGRRHAANPPAARDAAQDDRICGTGAFAQLVYDGWSF